MLHLVYSRQDHIQNFSLNLFLFFFVIYRTSTGCLLGKRSEFFNFLEQHLDLSSYTFMILCFTLSLQLLVTQLYVDLLFTIYLSPELLKCLNLACTAFFLLHTFVYLFETIFQIFVFKIRT